MKIAIYSLIFISFISAKEYFYNIEKIEISNVSRQKEYCILTKKNLKEKFCKQISIS